MTLTIPEWLLQGVAWVLITGIAGGVAMFLQRRGKAKGYAKHEARSVVEENVLVTIVRDNTKAMQEVADLVRDNKSISVQVSTTLSQVQQVLAVILNEVRRDGKTATHAQPQPRPAG